MLAWGTQVKGCLCALAWGAVLWAGLAPLPSSIRNVQLLQAMHVFPRCCGWSGGFATLLTSMLQDWRHNSHLHLCPCTVVKWALPFRLRELEVLWLLMGSPGSDIRGYGRRVGCNSVAAWEWKVAAGGQVKQLRQSSRTAAGARDLLGRGVDRVIRGSVCTIRAACHSGFLSTVFLCDQLI